MRKKKIEGQMSFDFTFFMDLSAEEENTLEQSTEVVGSDKIIAESGENYYNTASFAHCVSQFSASALQCVHLPDL